MSGSRENSSRREARQGHLLARPQQSPIDAPAPPLSLQTLKLDHTRDTLLYVPARYQPDHPAALALLLHGAGGHAQNGLDLWYRFADAANVFLVAPASRDYTWDVLIGDYGPDCFLIDRAVGPSFRAICSGPGAHCRRRFLRWRFVRALPRPDER